VKAHSLAARAAFGLGLAGAALAPARSESTRGFDIAAFARLPVLEGGRVKPVDSIARNSLLAMRGHQDAVVDGRTLGADEWLLEAMFRPEVADQQPVFFVDDPDVLGMLGMAQSSQRYRSFAELLARGPEIEQQADAARAVDPKARSRFQGAIVNLYDRLLLYVRLRATMQLPSGPPLAAELAAGDADAPDRRAELAARAFFRPLAPMPDRPADEWRSVGEALAQPGPRDPALEVWGRLGAAWAAQDAAAFGRAAKNLNEIAELRRPSSAATSERELLFNRAQPFYAGMVLYVLAFLMLCASWLWKPGLLRPASFGLLAAGATVHTAGLVARVWLQGRPPVTNLYSSAIFVGWVAVLLGTWLERRHGRGFGTAVASVCGFATLLVAHHLASDGDTMEMMRAVLDSNFWLATHVVTITVGYGATFLAGGLAVGYAVRRRLVREPDAATTRALVSATYGTVCFALLFSFVGTVLGGIWADQSWGRFWGWDPKENGALLIVLWNAIILHARWGGFVREKGLMAMAVAGNVVTSLSWFGVNMLGVGLHSYGFMDGAFKALAAFVASQLLLAGMCLLPPRGGTRAVASPRTQPSARPRAAA